MVIVNGNGHIPVSGPVDTKPFFFVLPWHHVQSEHRCRTCTEDKVRIGARNRVLHNKHACMVHQKT